MKTSHCFYSLRGTISRRCTGIDLCGPMQIISHRKFGPRCGGDVDYCRQRHHIALLVSNMELSHIFCASSKLAFRLRVHLPLAAEPVEIINERAAHECLQRSVNMAEFHTLRQHLVAIDFSVNLWSEKSAAVEKTVGISGRFRTSAM